MISFPFFGLQMMCQFSGGYVREPCPLALFVLCRLSLSLIRIGLEVKHKIASLFLLLNVLLLDGCLAEDHFSDEGDFDYSVVLDDLTPSYGRCRLWYDEVKGLR